MNDPHVERLRYRLQVDTRFIDFDNPSPLVQECSKFRFTLENGLLKVEMKDHCESVEEAKRVIEHELLNDWVISFAIELERDVIKFEFIDADVIDRKPSPTILGQITAKAPKLRPLRKTSPAPSPWTICCRPSPCPYCSWLCPPSSGCPGFAPCNGASSRERNGATGHTENTEDVGPFSVPPCSL